MRLSQDVARLNTIEPTKCESPITRNHELNKVDCWTPKIKSRSVAKTVNPLKNRSLALDNFKDFNPAQFELPSKYTNINELLIKNGRISPSPGSGSYFQTMNNFVDDNIDLTPRKLEEKQVMAKDRKKLCRSMQADNG